jgi:hypothetical protein
MNQIIEVLVELDNGKMSNAFAKIEKDLGSSYLIRYLSPTKKLHGDLKIYAYENDTYEIDKESVSGFYDSTKEEDAGFVAVNGGWVLDDEPDEYAPSGTDETESDVSFTDSARESEEED